MKSEIEKCKDLFESILCLCSEGPEFYSKLELMDTIIKEASKGYGICKSHQPEDSADNILLRQSKVCDNCGAIHRLVSEAEECCR